MRIKALDQHSRYHHCRAYFQSHKDQLTSEQLKFLKTIVGAISERYPAEKEQFEDLIMDIECEYERLDREPREPHFIKEPKVEIIPNNDIMIDIAPDVEKINNLYTEIERNIYATVLKRFKHNRLRASKFLGVSYRTVSNKIRLFRELGYTKELQ